MKKVLALVLALTMVLGFAATASASYFGNYIKYDFFAAGGSADYTVGGDAYITDMDVDGNKEYTIKAKFNEGDIAPFFGNIDETYDTLYNEYRVLEAIESYTANNFLGTADWNTSSADTNNIYSTHGNPLYEAVSNIYPTVTDSTLYDALIKAVSDHATSATPFKDGYNDSAFQTVKRATERAWNTYYSNGYYGYDKGIVATATSKDTTYATITSQPTVDVSRTVGGTTEYEVSFKVRFTNTTFRKADVDIEVVFNAGGAVQQAYYEHKDTLSFTVFQAQYRTFTEQDARPAYPIIINKIQNEGPRSLGPCGAVRTNAICAGSAIDRAESPCARTGKGRQQTFRLRLPTFVVCAADWQRGLPARKNPTITRRFVLYW